MFVATAMPPKAKKSAAGEIQRNKKHATETVKLMRHRSTMCPTEALSREMAKLMRHQAGTRGVRYSRSWWMEVQDVACALNTSFGQIKHVAEYDAGDRFELWLRGGVWMCRASGKQTLPSVDDDGDVLNDHGDVSVIVGSKGKGKVGRPLCWWPVQIGSKGRGKGPGKHNKKSAAETLEKGMRGKKSDTETLEKGGSAARRATRRRASTASFVAEDDSALESDYTIDSDALHEIDNREGI